MNATTTSSQKATAIIGSSVVTRQGEHLGVIKDMLVDQGTSKVSYCVVSCGGIFGLGRKLFAIPFSALAYRFSEGRYVMDIPKHRMTRALGFDASHWPTVADEHWSGQANSFFNTPPYWKKATDKQTGGKSSANR